MTPDRPPGAESRPPTWTTGPSALPGAVPGAVPGGDDPGRLTWAVGPGERPMSPGAAEAWAAELKQDREQERKQEPRRLRGRWRRRVAAGAVDDTFDTHGRDSVDSWVVGSRLSTVPARAGIVAGLLLYVLAAYWTFTPLEVPTAQGPPFRCGTALSHPQDVFGRNVCGQLNNRYALKAGAAALAGIVVIAGGFFVTAPTRREE